MRGDTNERKLIVPRKNRFNIEADQSRAEGERGQRDQDQRSDVIFLVSALEDLQILSIVTLAPWKPR